MRAIIEQSVASVNARLASYESVKRVEILSEDFTVESGELTPSMKVKRKVVTERYTDLFDSMYDDAVQSI
jgi:long-chain acyl-CoA synthetase